MKAIHCKLVALALVLLPFLSTSVQAVHVDFTAQRAGDIATGYFEWSATDTIIYNNVDQFNHGKTLWRITGAIALNGLSPQPMTDTTLEVMNNSFIDAPVPNSLIGDQITLFGTAAAGSGLQSVQNFYFRDESGLLFSSVAQPSTQASFDAFSSVRIDLAFGSGIQTFTLTQWTVVAEVPEPTAPLLLLIGCAGIVFSRNKRHRHATGF